MTTRTTIGGTTDPNEPARNPTTGLKSFSACQIIGYYDGDADAHKTWFHLATDVDARDAIKDAEIARLKRDLLKLAYCVNSISGTTAMLEMESEADLAFDYVQKDIAEKTLRDRTLAEKGGASNG